MRFKAQHTAESEEFKQEKRKFFAWFPVTINGETRWLETVTIEEWYYVGTKSKRVRFMESHFID